MNLNIKLNKYRANRMREGGLEAGLDDDTLAPVMPAIDVVQQLIEQESRQKKTKKNIDVSKPSETEPSTSKSATEQGIVASEAKPEVLISKVSPPKNDATSRVTSKTSPPRESRRIQARQSIEDKSGHNSLVEIQEDAESSILVRNNPLINLISNCDPPPRQDEYEFIPKSVILDVYSNDPEVKRFLKQLTKIYNESGYNEQDYKCYSCRRPVGLVFGQSRLCHYDGHHYCSECHLSEKSVIPARILCNWDFNKYPVSKRNQHFLTLISNEPMFELKKVAPLLYKMCPELREIEELRRQAFFVRSYCTTCVQEHISFELTKLIWPREHLIKQIDLYSLEDLNQVKNGTLKQVLKNVITFGRQHVLSCVLCCQKGFICELCKSSQIIYPFDTESVYRCNECQSIYHKACFKSKPGDGACPRCQRLKARRHET